MPDTRDTYIHKYDIVFALADFDVCDVVLMFLFAGYERAIRLCRWINLWLHVGQTGQSAVQFWLVRLLCHNKTKHNVDVQESHRYRHGWKKETEIFFCNIFYETQAIPEKFGSLFPE